MIGAWMLFIMAYEWDIVWVGVIVSVTITDDAVVIDPFNYVSVCVCVIVGTRISVNTVCVIAVCVI